jgi:hypothetical protein
MVERYDHEPLVSAMATTQVGASVAVTWRIAQAVGQARSVSWRIANAVGASRSLSWAVGDFVVAVGAPVLMRIVTRPVPPRRWQVHSSLVVAWRIDAVDPVERFNRAVALLEVDEDLLVMAGRSR